MFITLLIIIAIGVLLCTDEGKALLILIIAGGLVLGIGVIALIAILLALNALGVI